MDQSGIDAVVDKSLPRSSPALFNGTVKEVIDWMDKNIEMLDQKGVLVEIYHGKTKTYMNIWDYASRYTGRQDI